MEAHPFGLWPLGGSSGHSEMLTKSLPARKLIEHKGLNIAVYEKILT